MFLVACLVLIILSAVFFVLLDGGWFLLYAAAFFWAIFAKFLLEKVAGLPMTYMHYMNISARPENELKRTVCVLIWLALSIWVSVMSYYDRG